MNTKISKLAHVLMGAAFAYSGASYGALGTMATQPLWLDGSVRHNMMLAMDDSNSMDFEVLTEADDGAYYLNTTTGRFFNDDGTYVNSGKKYAYLFPNGYGSYPKRIVSRYRMPPIKPYAFTRSPSFNTLFYNPDITYEPWPSYGGYSTTYTDADLAKTQYDPHFDSDEHTINLFVENSMVFDILDDQMICDDLGGDKDSGSCTSSAYSFYPATYYLKSAGGTFTVSPDLNDGFDDNNSVLFEAESANLSATEFDLVSGSEVKDTSGSSIGQVDSLTIPYSNPPTSASALTYSFTAKATAAHTIWIRRSFPDDGTDSFWLNLQDIADSAVTLATTNIWEEVLSDGQYWLQWKDGHPGHNGTSAPYDNTGWVWEKFGTVDLVEGSNHKLRIKYREPDALMDQILVTTNTTDTPVGVVDLTEPTTYDCTVENGIAAYNAFITEPEKFTFNGSAEAIAPDGSCLQKYQLTTALNNADAFDNGSTVRTNVTVEDEKQNFANWFMYHRRRHQVMRGALGDALKSISGINAGIFWINSKSGNVTMYNMNDSDDNQDDGVAKLLTKHYNHVGTGSTPLRSALNYAANQFDTNTNIVTIECQKNFTLLFTDGFATYESVSGISNEDNSTIDGISASSPYLDSYSSTLADIAYKYYMKLPTRSAAFPADKVNISQSCDDDDDTPDSHPYLDCNSDLHMNTYTVNLGSKGTIAGVTHHSVKDAYPADVGGVGNPVWPNVNTDTPDSRRIDDLYHAAVNGRGGYYRAERADLLADALSSAVQDIISKIGSGSGVTFNTSSLDTGSLIFSTTFNSTAWSGDLVARALNSDGSVQNNSAWGSDPDRGVAELLDERDLSTNDRVIITYDGANGTSFDWTTVSAMSDTSIVADLNTGPSSIDNKGAQRLAYIRGDRSLEGTDFRTRNSRMGDIVHSAPVYVARPASNWPDKTPFGDGLYSDYRNRNQTDSPSGMRDRTPTIWVGANDGMVHGFNANTDTNTDANSGQEVLAFIPKAMFSDSTNDGMHYLTDPNYKHQYYVDLTPVAQDVHIKAPSGNGIASTASWKTILVGGYRGGKKGLYALDITDPSTFSQNNAGTLALWEFTDADSAAINSGDSSLGHITSSPGVAMLNNGKWAVVFGNGYNATDDSTQLMILFIEEGIDGWVASDIKMIDTGVSGGLSGVALADLTNDRIPDRVYGGDLNGNMWVFDISDADDSKWGVAYKSTGGGGGGTPLPLFTAKDGSGNAQPITAAPNLALNTEGDNSGADVLVVFGTGQYLIDGDVTSTDQQSFYVVWDHEVSEILRDDLEPRILTETSGVVTVDENQSDPIDWTANGNNAKHGWYMDFISNSTDPAERLTHKPLLRPTSAGIVAIFATIEPKGDECSGGGNSVLYAIPIQNGLNTDEPIMDLDGDGLDDNDLGIGTVKDELINEPNALSDNIYGSKGSGQGIDVTEGDLSGGSDRVGRLGWHELITEE